VPERTVNLEIEEAYQNLKTALLEKGCKVLSEQPPRQIMVKQGSLWGISPKTAKKIVDLNLQPIDNRTQVTYSSKLASDWKNVTLVGCILASILVGLCLWMATDLATLMITHEPSFWSWLVMAGGNVDFQAAQAFVNLTYGLAIFLSVIILLETAIVSYVHSKIDTFAEEALIQLS
jgi:hypothetical protein